MLTNKYFATVNVEDVLKTSGEYLLFMDDRFGDILEEIRVKKTVSEELEGRIKAAADEFVKSL
jgi:F-type H+-transporting ATPase subunit alpha